MLAVLVVGALALAWDQLDDTVKSAKDIETLLGYAPIADRSRRWPAATASRSTAWSRCSRHSRQRRRRSARCGRTSPSRASTPRSGRWSSRAAPAARGSPTIAANLAVVLAQEGRKVLLVDADLRRPTLHEMFRVPQTVGLTSLLNHPRLTLERVSFATEVDGLRIIPSGVLPPKLHEEIAECRQLLGRRKLLLALFGGSFASMVVGFVGPIGSLGPKPRGERNRTAWTPGARLVTAEGRPVEASGATFDQLITVFPEGFIGVDDSQVVLLRMPPEVLTERTVEAGPSRAGSPTPRSAPTPAARSACSASTTARPTRCASSSARATSRSSIPSTALAPSAARRRARCRNWRLDVDAQGYLVARGDFDGPVGPLAWDEA